MIDTLSIKVASLEKGVWAKCTLMLLYSKFGGFVFVLVFLFVLLNLQPELASTVLPKHSTFMFSDDLHHPTTSIFAYTRQLALSREG